MSETRQELENLRDEHKRKVGQITVRIEKLQVAIDGHLMEIDRIERVIDVMEKHPKKGKSE